MIRWEFFKLGLILGTLTFLFQAFLTDNYALAFVASMAAGLFGCFITVIWTIIKFKTRDKDRLFDRLEFLKLGIFLAIIGLIVQIVIDASPEQMIFNTIKALVFGIVIQMFLDAFARMGSSK